MIKFLLNSIYIQISLFIFANHTFIFQTLYLKIGISYTTNIQNFYAALIVIDSNGNASVGHILYSNLLSYLQIPFHLKS